MSRCSPESGTAFDSAPMVVHGSDVVRDDDAASESESVRIPLTGSISEAPNERRAAPDSEEGDAPAPLLPSPRSMLTASLQAHAARLNIARVRADFEQTLLTVLTLNVLYMYYIDHKLLVLFIRASQVIRLLYFPDATPTAQRGTALLLFMSNVPVVLIHATMFARDIGAMLFINFIGPEPKSLAKILYVDALIMVLQSILLQCKWDTTDLQLLSSPPMPHVAQAPAESQQATAELDPDQTQLSESESGSIVANA